MQIDKVKDSSGFRRKDALESMALLKAEEMIYRKNQNREDEVTGNGNHQNSNV